MATHRISGEFVAVMEEMDGSPEESAEVLFELLHERFGYLKRFDVYIDPSRCEDEEEV
jgi:hypothetical protein